MAISKIQNLYYFYFGIKYDLDGLALQQQPFILNKMLSKCYSKHVYVSCVLYHLIKYCTQNKIYSVKFFFTVYDNNLAVTLLIKSQYRAGQ